MAVARPQEPRNALRDLADEIPNHALSVVVAPAGSGKTTLLEAWRARLEAGGHRVAWLDLSPLHSDASSFVGDLRDAVQARVVGFGSETERVLAHLSGDADDWRLMARAFRRDWSRVGVGVGAAGIEDRRQSLAPRGGPPTLCCVLDGFHVIATGSDADRFLSELLRTPVPGLCFAISSRGTLPTGVARLRAAGAMLEVSGDDLFLRLDEARELVRRRGVDADEAVVAQLLAQTEGWVTGLILASHALTRIPKSEHARFADELSRHPDLFAYIAAEVLEGEPPELVHTVECAALVGRCSVRELREVSGDPKTSEWTDVAVDHGILQAEGTQVWPQRLWQELLRDRLRARTSDEEWHALQLRVAGVHQQAGRDDLAMEAFAEAQDWRGLGGLLVDVGADWVVRGRAARIEEWLERIPSAIADSEPALLTLRAGSLTRSQPDEAEKLLQRASEAYAARGEVSNELSTLGGRAALLFLQGRYDEVRPLVRRALRASRLLTRREDRGLALTGLAGLAYMTRRFDLSLRLSDRAQRHPLHGLAAWVVAMNRALIRSMRGEMEAALEVVETALARDDLTSQPYAYYTLRVQRGGLRAILGDLTAGRAEVEASLPELSDYRLRFQRDAALRVLAVTRALMGDHELALEAARERVALHTGHDAAAEAAARARVAVQLWLVRDAERARAAAEQSIALFEEVFPKQRHVWPWDFTTALCVLAHTGGAERAWQIAERHAKQLRQPDVALTDHIVLLQLHAIAHFAGQPKRAAELADEAWEVARAADLRFSDPLWGPELSALAGAAALRSDRASDFVFDRLRDLAADSLPGILTELLRDRSAAVRERAARWMARLGGRDLHAPLQAAVKDKSPKVAAAAKAALEGLDLRPGFQLSLRTLGEFEARRGDEAVGDAAWKGATPRRLLFRLLAAEGRPVPRDTLVADLWPDADDESARNNLRVALSRLHDALDPERPSGSPGYFIEAKGDGLAVRSDAIAAWDLLDLRAAEREARTADRAGELDVAISAYQHALSLYRGEFLPETRYDEWAIPIRTRLREAVREMGERVAELLLAAGRPDEVLEVAARLIAEDAADESGWSLRMRAHIAAADRTAALRAFAEATEALRSVLDLEPSGALRKLAALARAEPAEARDKPAQEEASET